MSEPTQSPPGPDASPDEIEADIAQTRARLADSVDALADKVNVKARAQEKVDDVKTTAQAKVNEVKATAQAKAEEVLATAQAKATVGQEKVVQGSREASRRVLALPRPVQIALAAAPVLLVALLVVRKARS
jgi:UDP-3-O-[3-hydroxymyristoyl] glucosamine N-acyltransferase